MHTIREGLHSESIYKLQISQILIPPEYCAEWKAGKRLSDDPLCSNSTELKDRGHDFIFS